MHQTMPMRELKDRHLNLVGVDNSKDFRRSIGAAPAAGSAAAATSISSTSSASDRKRVALEAMAAAAATRGAGTGGSVGAAIAASASAPPPLGNGMDVEKQHTSTFFGLVGNGDDDLLGGLEDDDEDAGGGDHTKIEDFDGYGHPPSSSILDMIKVEKNFTTATAGTSYSAAEAEEKERYVDSGGAHHEAYDDAVTRDTRDISSQKERKRNNSTRSSSSPTSASTSSSFPQSTSSSSGGNSVATAGILEMVQEQQRMYRRLEQGLTNMLQQERREVEQQQQQRHITLPNMHQYSKHINIEQLTGVVSEQMKKQIGALNTDLASAWAKYEKQCDENSMLSKRIDNLKAQAHQAELLEEQQNQLFSPTSRNEVEQLLRKIKTAETERGNLHQQVEGVCEQIDRPKPGSSSNHTIPVGSEKTAVATPMAAVEATATTKNKSKNKKEKQKKEQEEDDKEASLLAEEWQREMREQKDSFERDIESLKTEISQTETIRAQRDKEIDSLRTERSALQQKISDLDVTVSQRKSNEDALKTEVNEMVNTNHELETKISEMKASLLEQQDKKAIPATKKGHGKKTTAQSSESGNNNAPPPITDDDVAEATAAKAAGNDAFKEGRFSDAMLQYSIAIDKTAGLMDSYDEQPPGAEEVRHAALLNRSQCYLNLKRWAEAKLDALSALMIRPAPVPPKAWFRLATAEIQLERYASAECALEHYKKLNITGGDTSSLRQQLEEKRREPRTMINRSSNVTWTGYHLSFVEEEGPFPQDFRKAVKICSEFEEGDSMTLSDSKKWVDLGAVGGGMIYGERVYTTACFVKAIEIDPDNAKAWHHLGCEGGGIVGQGELQVPGYVLTVKQFPRRRYTSVECYVKALELSNPGNSRAWSNLALALKPHNRQEGTSTRVNGKTYSSFDCHVKALEVDDKNWCSWCKLCALGGNARIKGRFYSQAQCVQQALEIDPIDGIQWNNLGTLGGGTVDGRKYNEKQCIIKSLEVTDLKNSISWSNLANEGGGRVLRKEYTRVECCVKAIETDPENFAGWRGLGYFSDDGTNIVGGKRYTRQECLSKALEIRPHDKEGWGFLGAFGQGGRVNGVNYTVSQCLIKALEMDGAASLTHEVWFNLGLMCGGGKVSGRRVNPKQCFVNALEIFPKYVNAWVNLGMSCGERSVHGKQYSAVECYTTALAIDPKCYQAWAFLGKDGGGSYKAPYNTRTRMTHFTPAQCFVKAIEIDANQFYGPREGLGELRGTVHRINGRQYTAAECMARATKMKKENPIDWDKMNLMANIEMKS